MRTIEQIKRDIRELEHELYDLQNEFSNIEFKDVDQEAYQKIQTKITKIQNDANNDIIYIKTIYGQLLSIRSNAELSVRQNNDSRALKTAEKVHQAFILLVEYNKILDGKLAEIRRLEGEIQRLIEKNSNNQSIAECEKKLASKRKQIAEKRQELIDVESQYSISAKTKNKIIEDIINQERIKDINCEITKTEAEKDALSKHAPSCKCGSKMELKAKNQSVFWGCPNYRENGEHSNTITCWDSKLTQPFKHLNDRLTSLKQEKGQISPNIELKDEEKEALRHSFITFDEYPDILDKAYSNYLFQSLAVPRELRIRENFTELLRYSRFRIFTGLPKSNTPDPKMRSIYSLALRLMNRGTVLPANEKIQAKLKRYFNTKNSSAFLLDLNEYITYEKPCNTYDSSTEKKFAEYYFPDPKLLGESWATYVYPQMPIEKLLPEEEQKNFVDQRVDFFVCYGGKKVVIELDGEEHQQKIKSDRNRDEKLRKNGYTVKRFSNFDVWQKGDTVSNELSEIFPRRPKGATVELDRRYLAACKVTHQIAIAIIKMLEEGHISSHCNLNVEISSKYFTSEEQRLLLVFAAEEARELIENFAKLYGESVDIDFFNKNAVGGVFTTKSKLLSS